jgi:hypothetical protein
MANSATLIDTIPVSFKNGGGPVYEYEIVIDTVDTDLNVRVPAVATNRVWLVGALMSDAAALNLTFKTATKVQTIELAANQGIYDKVDGGFIFVGAPGETLIIRSSGAIGASVGKNLILRVLEAQRMAIS